MNGIMEISNLEKGLDSFHLGPINLTLEPGTITALVGNNGSGKSTILKLIMNLVKPDKGNIKVLNKFVHGPDEGWKTTVSYQPQPIIGWNAFSGRTLKKFIAPYYPNWDEHLFEEMVKRFDISLDKKFIHLSPDLQQKLCLALTLPKNTPLLLLDEPTTFMDIPAKQVFLDMIVAWMERGDRAIVMTSHQSSDIMKLADYLCVLKRGEWVGTYEKEALNNMFKRYWLSDTLPAERIPGELLRTNNQIISNNPDDTEAYFHNQHIKSSSQARLDLEEIITLLVE
ncbi:ABC transporter ATP-binding protein [Virgibacillus salarius]|uniref:ATP-binding cassette domain-containing protein n=1 Tax=Virgibacillus salarius TaxID=447199 RepID=UPI00249042BF|nr:ABC transporter ATP-binding protein [Virgibacillus salarius]WBX81762.1 ABC transporter ATP-binding protein [Virgibacillus salarius]